MKPRVTAGPLRGRDAELAQLASRVRTLAAGRGGAVVVRGVPGAGKTRMLNEVCALAERSGVRTAWGSGDRTERVVPFAGLLGALTCPSEPMIAPETLRWLQDRADQRFWLLLELQNLLVRAALAGPLMIVVDDLHWCDAGTLLALRTLPERLPSERVLWVVASRTCGEDPDVRHTIARLLDGGAATIDLPPLPQDAVSLMAEDVLRAKADPALRRLLDRADGRPLLVMELLSGLVDEGAVTTKDGVARTVGERVPDLFHRSVQRRFSELTPAASDILGMASVLGQEVDPGLLAELAGRPVAALLAPLEEAIAADLLAEDGDRLRFRHELVRDAIRRTLPGSFRTALRHQAAGARLAAPRRAPAKSASILGSNLYNSP